MVAVLRFFGNVLLAIFVIILTLIILLAGYGAVMASVWETSDPEEGVAGGAWAEIDDQRIYYQVVGPEEGTAVLLIHGLGVEGLQVWNDSPLTLSKSGLRVISADLSGFGYSARDVSSGLSLSEQAETLGILLDRLEAKQITVVGQGWGGAVALRLAQDRPDVVRQVVLVAPLLMADTPIWPPLLRLPYISRGATWMIASGGPIWGLVRRLGFDNPALLTSDLLASMRQPTHVRGTIDAVTERYVAGRGDISDLDVSKVRVPVLIIAGDRDRFVRLEDVQQLAERFPDATLMTVEDAGHYVHIEQSLEVNRSLIQFCLGDNP